MGFKAIKQHYGIKHIVAIYNEEKYGGDCICIGSGYVHGLIAINIETGKVFHSSIVTPGENSEIGQLAARIIEDEKNGGTIPQWQKDLAHWTNRRELLTSCDFKDFQPRQGFYCSEYFNN